MPRPTKTGAKKARGLTILNPVSTARELFAIVREMSFEDLHDAALRPPRVAVVGPSLSEARRAALHVFGPEARAQVVTAAETDSWPTGAEVVLLDQRVRAPGGVVPETVVPFTIDDSRE